MTHEELTKLTNIVNGAPFDIRRSLHKFVSEAEVEETTLPTPKKRRTATQNAAMHLFFDHLATELNDAGWDMRKTLKPEVSIPWTGHSIKEHLWRPIQMALYSKESTTDLSKDQVGHVYEVLNRHIGEKTGVHVPFPTDPDKENQLIKALEKAAVLEYPRDYSEPAF